jgi:hypothetical protein
MDVLRRSGTEECTRPMTTIKGYWGDVFEFVGLLANMGKMMKSYWSLNQKKSKNKNLTKYPLHKIKSKTCGKLRTHSIKIDMGWRRSPMDDA